MRESRQIRSWAEYIGGEKDFSFLLNSVLSHLPLIEEILNYNPKRVLEVACGTGVFSIFLSYFDIEAVGIDNDSKIVETTQKNNIKLKGRAKFITQDAFKFEFSSKSFDVAFSQGFLEHFSDENVRKLVKEQLRVANIVIASVPSKYYGRRDRGDERLLAESEWIEILAEIGNVKISGYWQKKFLPLRIIDWLYAMKESSFWAKIYGRANRNPNHYIIKIEERK